MKTTTTPATITTIMMILTQFTLTTPPPPPTIFIVIWRKQSIKILWYCITESWFLSFRDLTVQSRNAVIWKVTSEPFDIGSAIESKSVWASIG